MGTSSFTPTIWRFVHTSHGLQHMYITCLRVCTHQWWAHTGSVHTVAEEMVWKFAQRPCWTLKGHFLSKDMFFKIAILMNWLLEKLINSSLLYKNTSSCPANSPCLPKLLRTLHLQCDESLDSEMQMVSFTGFRKCSSISFHQSSNLLHFTDTCVCNLSVDFWALQLGFFKYCYQYANCLT